MSFLGDWALTRNCTIYPYLGRDSYGGVSFGDPVYLECAIRWKLENQKVRDNNGDELRTKYEIRFKDQYLDLFKERNYIVLDMDTSANPDPIDAGGDEIKIIRGVAGDMVGSDDSYKAWV